MIKLDSMSKKALRGFTLIELLVVIAIIGLLAGIVLISLGGAREEARRAKARSEINAIRTALLRLEIDTNEWPNHQTPWQIWGGGGANEVWDLNTEDAGLTQNDTAPAYAGWRGPYLDAVPLDPWGNPYFFDTDYDLYTDLTPCGQPPRDPCNFGVAIGSFGPNGAGQNDYDEDDIILILVKP